MSDNEKGYGERVRIRSLSLWLYRLLANVYMNRSYGTNAITPIFGCWLANVS